MISSGRENRDLAAMMARASPLLLKCRTVHEPKPGHCHRRPCICRCVLEPDDCNACLHGPRPRQNWLQWLFSHFPHKAGSPRFHLFEALLNDSGQRNGLGNIEGRGPMYSLRMPVMTWLPINPVAPTSRISRPIISSSILVPRERYMIFENP